MKKKLISMVVLFILLTDGAAFAAPATIGYVTAIHKYLVSLPLPEKKIVVAVYKFRDQTGQYKQSQGTTFSTAVTQGATSMIVKALEDSGWFELIEREGLQNLLTERKIIRSTIEEYRKNVQAEQDNLVVLPPLLYASVLLEGGIISYETNPVTGGFGAKYLGLGGFTEGRRDQVTIYLRAISTKNGKILKSVTTTKSIISKEITFSIFKFVRTNSLLEVETGFSTNEPIQMCVLEAIEKAVYDLIVEGILDKIWNLKNPEDINSPAIQNYLKEKEAIEKKITSEKDEKDEKAKKSPPSFSTDPFSHFP